MPTPVVVYSANNGSIRRIILPDTAAQAQMFLTALSPGEAALALPVGKPTDVDSCRAAVAALRGVPSASGRCAVIDGTNTVTGILLGDPLLDQAPQGTTLVAHDTVAPGDKWDGSTFSRYTIMIDNTTGKVVTAGFQPIGVAAPAGQTRVQGTAVLSYKVGSAVPGFAAAAPLA